MKIRTKYTATIVFFIIIAIMFGIIFLNKTIRVTKDSAEDYVAYVGLERERALEVYIDETIAIGWVMQYSQVFQEYIAAIDSGSEEVSTDAASDLLYSFQEAKKEKYHHLFLIDQNEKIVLSPSHSSAEAGSPDSHLGEDISDNIWAMQALHEGVTTISDYSSLYESEHSHQMMFFPLKNAADETKLVLGVEMQIPYVLDILSDGIELGEKGAALLVSNTGHAITYDTLERETIIESPGIKEAITNGYFLGETQNQFGDSVIGAYRRHGIYPWILVVEVDTSEALEDTSAIVSFFALIMSIAFFVIMVSAVVLMDRLVGPIKKLTESVESVSSGGLYVPVVVESNDEIEDLARAYDKMAVTILDYRKEQKDKVKTKTNNLTKNKKN